MTSSILHFSSFISISVVFARFSFFPRPLSVWKLQCSICRSLLFLYLFTRQSTPVLRVYTLSIVWWLIQWYFQALLFPEFWSYIFNCLAISPLGYLIHIPNWICSKLNFYFPISRSNFLLSFFISINDTTIFPAA